MGDSIVTALAFGGTVRITAAITTETVGTAAQLHALMPVTSAALGRSLTGVILMSNMLKNDSDKITFQIKGDGPLGGLLVTGDRFANVKGYVNNPNCDLPVRNGEGGDGKLDVSGAVGNGYLQVIKDIGLKEPYIGMVNLVSGEIAEDLTYYFAVSEQINSAIGLGVLVNPDNSVAKSGGYMIQLLPGADEECISFLEKRFAYLPSVVSLIGDLADSTAEEKAKSLIEKIFEKESIEFLETKPCGYVCGCSKEKMEKNLITIGVKDLEELAEEKQTELLCHFCNSKYIFSSAEILDLIKSIT